MPASFPASMVNQKPADLGIPNRFSLNSSRFRLAGKTLSQRFKPIERGSRQRALFDRGERILELLRRRHADQDGANGRVADGKPRGGFS